MRYLFFINPKAGKGKQQNRIIENIKEYFRKNQNEYNIYVTKFKGDAEKKAREEAATGDEITMFACGGEGTCYEVLNGIVGYDNVRLGVIPCGSANDFLKFFDNKSAFFDLESQLAGEAIPVDLIKAGDRYCLNGCSVGMDAMVALDMILFKRLPLISGSIAYKLAIVRVFFKKLGVKIKLSVDKDSQKEVRCLFAVIANGPIYGGGYKSAPDACPFDGKLDFTMVDVISRFKILKFLKVYEKAIIKTYLSVTLKIAIVWNLKVKYPFPLILTAK